MHPVEPWQPLASATRIELAATQPDLAPLICYRAEDRFGTVMTEWELSAEDLAVLIDGGRLRLFTFTYGARFQPIRLEIVSRDLQVVSADTAPELARLRKLEHFAQQVRVQLAGRRPGTRLDLGDLLAAGRALHAIEAARQELDSGPGS